MLKPEQALYEEDFVRWTAQQARLLREGARRAVSLPLDWENLAEEVESLGRSDRREMENRLSTIMVHLLKLEASTAAPARAGWRATIREQRRALIKGVLRDSPSLQKEIAAAIVGEMQDARQLAADQLDDYGELTDRVKTKLATASYTEEQVLGDWFPDER